MSLRVIGLCGLFVFSTAAFSGPDHPPAQVPKEFESMKRLLGTWEGTSVMQGTPQAVTVVYELTSGGTAIIEKLMTGTPHEMVSVYHKDGKSVAMTHYCVLGNQPTMKLKHSDGNHFGFEMENQSGLESADEPHMHAVTLTLDGDQKLKQEWAYYAQGKKSEVVAFDLTRKD